MTYEESRRILLTDFRIGEKESADAMLKAVESLEKQIPKKPSLHYMKYKVNYSTEQPILDYWECPCCGNAYDEEDNFCPNCGQAILWE